MNKGDYYIEVWRRAVLKAEEDLRQLNIPLVGGIKQDESLESYVIRGRKLQDEALEKLKTAREELKKAKAWK